MNRDLRCFCGDSECPSCGTAQGTYSGPSDPGPGVAEVEEFQRMANRPPDAVLDPTDVAALAGQQLEEMERRIRSEMARRDAVEAALKAEVDWWGGEWANEYDRVEKYRRYFHRLILIGGFILAIETVALVGLIWRLLP